jgi:hypothetical protein
MVDEIFIFRIADSEIRLVAGNLGAESGAAAARAFDVETAA